MRGATDPGGRFQHGPETFGQYATPARLPGVLVKAAAPTFRHGVSVRCFDYFVSTAQWHARFGKCECWRIQASALIIRSS